MREQVKIDGSWWDLQEIGKSTVVIWVPKVGRYAVPKRKVDGWRLA